MFLLNVFAWFRIVKFKSLEIVQLSILISAIIFPYPNDQNILRI